MKLSKSYCRTLTRKPTYPTVQLHRLSVQLLLLRYPNEYTYQKAIRV